MDDTVILIPVRLQATRFPNKPFAKIGNLPMLHYVYNSASNFFSNVYLAICDELVREYCNQNNIQYVMTDPSHVSGSDRIGEAIEILEKQKNFQYIINLQGDMPFVKEKYISSLREKLLSYEMSTLACPFKDLQEATNESKVKVETTGGKEVVANDFYRTLKSNKKINEDIFHHIGVYGYQKNFLKKFISFPPSLREQEEKLEQLRIIDITKISIVHIDEEILGVDTKEDLDTVNQQIQNHV
jgi:3-deoxy-manno-octulosonate cytidylyltransferase (CMP-KDO synthetase)